MKKIFIVFLLSICTSSILAQEEFHFDRGVDKVSIPFQFINNLIFIPIEVNGVELNFLLDSGVEETILFSLDDKKEVQFSNVEKITMRGLGSEEAIEGLKSKNNLLSHNGIKLINHELYVVLDQEFNLSSHVGIPVNGIIGYHFLKNNLVEINYERKRVIVYRDNEKNRKKIEKKFNATPISIERSKPYIISSVFLDSIEIQAKLLIDLGNSDALWFFENRSDLIKVPTKNFEDYLGKGFSGDIGGKRARISKFSMAEFEFDNLIAAFPDTTSIRNVKMVPGRVGSVGGEIMKRFTVIFDYQNRKMYLNKNHNYDLPFSYNKSGIEIQHHGLQWVKETVRLETVPISPDTYDSGGIRITSDFRYKFQLKPIYEIGNIRKNSPAANCGLQKGDIIVTINKIQGYKYSLQEINSFLKSEEEKWITLEVERESKIIKFKFQLQDIL